MELRSAREDASPWNALGFARQLLEYAVVARIFLERRSMFDVIPMDDDLRGLLGELHSHAGAAVSSGDCVLPLDVVETASGIEIVLDAAGVREDSLEVLFVQNTLVVVGRKEAPRCEHHAEAAFHLAERTFGRFARGVRLAGAFDAGRAEATLRDGELRVTLPRIEERRGAEIRIAVRAD